MNKFYASFFAGALLCGISLAQNTTTSPSNDPAPPSQSQSPQPQEAQQPQPDPAPSTQPTPSNTDSSQMASPRIAPGSVIPVQLTKGIDAKRTKPGDEVEARVTQDLKAGNGDLVIAKDTKVVGHVTEAQARTKEQRESQIGIAFDHAVMKDGDVVSLPMSIQAIISSQALNPGHESNDGGAAQPSAPDAGATPMNGGGGRSTGMGGGMAPAHPPSTSATGADSAGAPGSSNSAPSITANTQGVVGISDMKLSTAGETAEGSVVSSEKNNIKLENGTLMLLRVNH